MTDPEPATAGCLKKGGTDTINDPDSILRQIAILRDRLVALDEERSKIADRLAALERAQAEEAKPPARAPAGVTMASPTAAKIGLFRSLFRGREDVLPRRWENPKTGKAGYAPMCRNEWVRGVCGKRLEVEAFVSTPIQSNGYEDDPRVPTSPPLGRAPTDRGVRGSTSVAYATYKS